MMHLGPSFRSMCHRESIQTQPYLFIKPNTTRFSPMESFRSWLPSRSRFWGAYFRADALNEIVVQPVLVSNKSELQVITGQEVGMAFPSPRICRSAFRDHSPELCVAITFTHGAGDIWQVLLATRTGLA
jgi:hypothetical protein